MVILNKVSVKRNIACNITLKLKKTICRIVSARACLVHSQSDKFSESTIRRIMASITNSKPAEVNGECPCSNKQFKMANNNKVTVVLGAQWGDEGKGKAVDLLSLNSDIVCRCQVIYF